MKRLVLTLALCCLPAAAARAQEPRQQQPPSQNESAKPVVTLRDAKPETLEAIPEEVFDRELKDLDGRSFFLSNYRGRVFVLTVWASWCTPCNRQVAELNKIYKEYAGRGVEVVALTTEDPKAEAKQVRDTALRLKLRYKVGWADSASAQALMKKRPSVPQTLVVTRDGRVLNRFLGYSEYVQAAIRKGIEDALTLPADAAPAKPDAAPRP